MAKPKGSRITGLDNVRLDPAVDEMLSQAVENRAALTAKQRRDRARTRATYDLALEVQKAIQEIAGEVNTSASQIAELFLAFAVREYRRGNPDLMAALENRSYARTPRFTWNLELPREWLEATAVAGTGWGVTEAEGGSEADLLKSFLGRS